MKKCLLLISGVSRTFDKTAGNLFQNIIEPNMKNIQFEIHICDDLNVRSTKKWNTTNIFKKNKELHTKKLMNAYNKYNQVKNIHFWSWDGEKVSKNAPDGLGINIKRWSVVLKHIKFELYDYFIFIRPDVIIDKKINLPNYKKEFSIISGNFTRSCQWHNRDWDYIWVGDNNAFLYWLIPYLYEERFQDLSIVYKDILEKFKKIEKLNNNEITKIKHIVNLKGHNNHSTVEYYCRIIKFMKLNGYDFSLSETKGIYSTIIRN